MVKKCFLQNSKIDFFVSHKFVYMSFIHSLQCLSSLCCAKYFPCLLFFWGDTNVNEEIKLFDSYLDIPNISSGDELLDDIELMEREPFDMRPTEALLELLANGGS